MTDVDEDKRHKTKLQLLVLRLALAARSTEFTCDKQF